MQSDFQVPFIVTFMFIIFPLVSFGAMFCYYKWAIKNKIEDSSNERRDLS